MSFARYLTALLFAIDRRSLAVRFVIVIALFLGVFVADYLTDWDISLRGLYFAPVALAAWTIGLRTGWVLGALAAMASFYCDLRAIAPVRNATFMATDTTIHFAVYAACALIVSHLRGALGLLEREKDQILLAARAAEDAHQLAFEASPLPLFVFDVETCMPLAVNESTLTLFGYTREEFLANPVPELAGPDEVAERERPLASGAAESSGVSHYLRKDGGRFVGEYTTRQFSFRNRRARMVLIKDITEKHAAEQARHEIERKLLRTEEQLRQSQKMEAIGRLAGGVAHDFNNLLSVILSYGAMLEEQAIAEGRPSEEAHEVRKAAERASELTKQLLLFSRQRVIETTVLDLNSLLSRIERMLQRVLGEDIELSFLLSPGAALVRAAETHLEQAIMNLVVNARDAMPEGGTLTIETSVVDLDGEAADAHVGLQPGPHVMLAVTDTGHGMDETTQARIFEPFFTTKGKGEGTGLGLSICARIIEKHGGNMRVESEPGRTRFTISLPVEGPASTAESGTSASDASVGAALNDMASGPRTDRIPS